MGVIDSFQSLPTANEITGSFGEWLAAIYSKTIPGALVLHDILIDGADGHTSQIDLVLIGSKGIYVVEMKMFSEAKIYGDTRKTKWYYFNHGRKYEIYSPLMQNKKHVAYLKDFLKSFGDVPCFSIITMICDDFKISGENGANTVICNSLPGMKKAMYKIAEKNPPLFDDSQKQAIYNYIKSNEHIGKEVRDTHKKSTMVYQERLEEMKTRKICPYCKTELIIRNGKHGEFYGCKNYPKCRYTLSK